MLSISALIYLQNLCLLLIKQGVGVISCTRKSKQLLQFRKKKKIQGTTGDISQVAVVFISTQYLCTVWWVLRNDKDSVTLTLQQQAGSRSKQQCTCPTSSGVYKKSLLALGIISPFRDIAAFFFFFLMLSLAQCCPQTQHKLKDSHQFASRRVLAPGVTCRPQAYQRKRDTLQEGKHVLPPLHPLEPDIQSFRFYCTTQDGWDHPFSLPVLTNLIHQNVRKVHQTKWQCISFINGW